MILSFDIIFWKIVLQNEQASGWFSQPRYSTKNKEISHWRLKEECWAELRNLRAWMAGFRALKRFGRSTFLDWCNDHLPNIRSDSPTSLPINRETFAAEDYRKKIATLANQEEEGTWYIKLILTYLLYLLTSCYKV